MADEENEESRSAADIVDDMADEMGIDEEEEPDSELSDEMKDELGGLFDEDSEAAEGADSGDESEEEATDETTEESAEDEAEAASDDGSSEEASTEETSDESGDTAEDEQEASDEDQTTEDPVNDAIDEEVSGEESDDSEGRSGAFEEAGEGNIGGVFDPDDEMSAESDAELGDDAYLDETDLEEYGDDSDYNKRTWVLGVAGGVAVFALFMLGYLVIFPEEVPRIEALARGELRAYEKFQAAQQQEEFEKKELAKLPKFGTLKMNGRPKYSSIKLDGETPYGKTSAGHWKAVRLTPGTTFRNLRIEEKHTVTVNNPSFQKKTWGLTQGHWKKKEGTQVDYQKLLTVALVPKSVKHHREFYQRLQKDPENNFFGKVTINTEPKGAKVIWNGEPLKNEEGEELTTPVTFEKYWTKKEDKDKEGDNGEGSGSEESGEDGDKLEENKVKVDMPPGKGHKIVLKMPEDAGDFPSYVTPLERQMWTCNWKSDRKIARLPDDAGYPARCNYSFKLDVNFSDLKGYIERREKERKRVKQQNKEIRETLKKSPGSAGSS